MHHDFRRTLCCFFVLIFFFVLPNRALAASLTQTATLAAKGLGEVTQTADGKLGQVFLFEENHASLTGQIEIAHMLVRLYKDSGLRTIGLEGAFASQKLIPQWAQSMSAGDRLRVSARLLADGELNSAEFMISAYTDVTVAGIDDENEYKLKLDKEASSSSVLYLMLIAEQSMTESQALKVNALISEKKVSEALDTAINADPWTKNKYGEMQSPSRINSTEVSLRHLEEIEAEARRRQIEVPDNLVQGMKAQKDFFRAATRRSDAMVSKIVEMAKENPRVPIAAIVGAAHTDGMASMLKERSVTFAVIRPNALSARVTDGKREIDYEAYERKVEGRSVDIKGLGGLLDGRRKPPPVISQPWLINKANIYQATLSVVERVLVDDKPAPYDLSSLPNGVFVDPKKITRVGDEIIFAVGLETNGRMETIWVRATYSNNVAQKSREHNSVDERITKLLEEADTGGGGVKEPPGGSKGAKSPEPGKRGDGKNKGGGPKKPSEGARQVAKGIYAVFAKERAVIEKQSVLISSAS